MNPNQAPRRRRPKAAGQANGNKRTQATGARQARARQPRREPANGEPVQVAAVAYAQVTRKKEPLIRYQSNGRTCFIKHCERFSLLVDNSSAFTVDSYAVNPGMSATFPWLSAIAQRFESYRFRSLRFEYRTKCSTTTVGDVILTVDYDAADAAPISSVQAENYADMVSCVPWQTVTQSCKAENLQKSNMWFVRTAALAANLDIKTYDVGNLFVCKEGTPNSGNNLGYLYVDYEIDLFTPQLNADAASLTFGGEITLGGAATAANPLGASPSVDPQSVGITVGATSIVTFAATGTYSVAWNLIGTVVTAMTITNVSNATVTTQAATVINAATTIATFCAIVVTAADNATVQFTATATTVTGGSVAIARGPASAYS